MIDSELPQPENTLAVAAEIDKLCDEFDARLRARAAPRIEEFLDRRKFSAANELLEQLLLIEIEYATRHNERLFRDDFLQRFPEHSDVVRRLFATLASTSDSLRSTVVRMGDTDETRLPVEDYAEKAVSEVPATRQFADYELIEEIGRGGMGVVYKARHVPLNRIVALKMIRSGQFAGDEEIRRFHAEAEAAAHLDHPHIVPVYDVGEQDGLHYFSMGFVQGIRLAERLREGPLPLKDAARLGQTIAEAVHFAHDKGVVHRDLKPGNVLLQVERRELRAESEDTEPRRSHNSLGSQPSTLHPRITDFGLAKRLDADSELTETGQVVGTPSYMPPEQARGDAAMIGRLSDVYSLGALLYALLTGRPPFQAASVLETLKQVLDQVPVSPRQLNPAVDRDLETICLKCLEKEPVRRYVSAAELADDLGRYLEGRPITARPVGRVEKSWRWTKRNKPLAAAIALTLFLAVAGPVMALRQMQLFEQASDNLAKYRTQKGVADQKVTELGEANVRLTNALANEQTARTLANHNLDHAAEVVKDFLTEIGRPDGVLADYSATQPLQRKLLEKGRDYYEKLIRDNQAERLSPRLADATTQLGLVQSQLSGDQAKALESYHRALVMYERLVQEQPENREYQRRLAGVVGLMGILHHSAGRLQKALDANRRADEILKRLLRDRPDDLKIRLRLAEVSNNIAILYDKLGRLDEALKLYLKDQAFWKEMVRKDPANQQHQIHLATCHSNTGNVYSKLGRLETALEEYRNALTIRERLSRQNPRDFDFRDRIADCHNNFAISYRRAGKPQLALDAHRKALAIRERLARENPLVARYQGNAAASHNNIGIVYDGLGKSGEAVQAHRRALAIRARLVDENPSVAEYQSELAFSHENLARLYQATGKHDEAIEAFQKALVLRERIIRDAPKRTEYLKLLKQSYLDLKSLHQKLGRVRKAVQFSLKELAVQTRIAAEHPGVLRHSRELASIHRRLGFLYEDLRDYPHAFQEWKQALAIRKRIADEEPKVPENRFDLAVSHYDLGYGYQLTGQRSTALQSYRNGREIVDELARRKPSAVHFRVLQCRLLQSIGVLSYASGNSAEAYRAYGQSRSIRRTILREKPGDTRFRIEQAMTCLNLTAMNIQYQHATDWSDLLEAVRNIAMVLEGDLHHAAAQRLFRKADVFRAIVHERLSKSGPSAKPAAIYNLAGLYSISSAIVNRDPARSADARRTVSDSNAAMAEKLLAYCDVRGYFRVSANIEKLRTDEDFEPLHSRPGFRVLAKRIGVVVPVRAHKPRRNGDAILPRISGVQSTGPRQSSQPPVVAPRPVR